MSEIIFSSAVAGLCTIAVAIIGASSARDRKKAEEDRAEAKAERDKAAARAAMRAQENRLSMAMQSANCKLAVVTAKAVLHQHTNGDVEEAMTAAQIAEEEYTEFIREVSAEKITK